jgi:hypothetical protein
MRILTQYVLPPQFACDRCVVYPIAGGACDNVFQINLTAPQTPPMQPLKRVQGFRNTGYRVKFLEMTRADDQVSRTSCDQWSDYTWRTTPDRRPALNAQCYAAGLSHVTYDITSQGNITSAAISSGEIINGLRLDPRNIPLGSAQWTGRPDAGSVIFDDHPPGHILSSVTIMGASRIMCSVPCGCWIRI